MRTRLLRVELLEDRWLPAQATAYAVTDLVSDQANAAKVQDPNLVNGWGIAVGPNTNFWVSSNGKDSSVLFSGDVGGHSLQIQPLVVSLPGGEPTGQLFNRTSGFRVSVNGASQAALFIAASESGHITGWAPGPGTPVATSAQDAAVVPDAVFKGITLVHNSRGNFLLAADFHNNRIDIFDSNFHLSPLSGHYFVDRHIPKGYAPFNVQMIHSRVYVTYAKQDADAHDDVKGAGHGFIDVFNTSGHLMQRFASRGPLNSPWGLALAPKSFGRFAGDLLVGNFGDGQINAYDLHGHFKGTLSDASGQPIVIDGLWGLAVGNGKTAGSKSALYFAAGPQDESHGLFGKVVVTASHHPNPPSPSPMGGNGY